MTALMIVSLFFVLSSWFMAVAWVRAIKKRDFAREILKDERSRVEALAARLRDVEPREARFRKALGYYADDETWVALGRAHSPAFHDRGKVAKLALNYDARYKAFADALESARTAADVSVAVAMSREALAGAQ